MNTKNYRDTLKSTSLFASVQIVIIAISILKSKTVAIWLGPYGLGIISIFSSITSMLYSITNLGLSSSSVKFVAEKNTNNIELHQVIVALRRWAFATGLIGMILTIVFSNTISEYAFKNNSHVVSFIFLSVVVLLNGLSYVNLAIIQGVQKLKVLAQANICAALISFVVSVPLYYYYGTKSIVLTLVLSAISLFVITEYLMRKYSIVQKGEAISFKNSWLLGLQPIKLGLMISFSFIAVTVAEFLIKTFIAKYGGLDDVGLYQAGWTLNATYLGMVFTAMSTDFFPKLSLIASNISEVKTKVNQQAEISLLLLGPLISIMIVSLPFIVQLFFSKDFLEMVTMTRLMLFGSFLRAGSWAISFIFLAKGNGKLYLFNELSVKAFTIPIYLVLYYYYGLEGIGYAYIIDQLFYLVWVSVAAWLKYNFYYTFEFYKLLVTIGFFSFLPFLAMQFESRSNHLLVVSVFSILVVVIFSLVNLNIRIGIVEMIKNKLRKSKNDFNEE